MSVNDIPGHISLSQSGVKAKKPTKNQKYQIRMSVIPQGMVCTSNIMSALMQMKYKEHEFLTLEDVAKKPYVLMIAVGGVLIERISHASAHGLDRAGLLGLINMSHFR